MTKIEKKDKSHFSEEEKGAKSRHCRRRHKSRSSMEMTTTVAEVHRSPPARVHTAARRNRSQSRHEKHKCHKHKQRQEGTDLINQVTQLRTENYLLNRKLNASVSSIDSGLPNNESLPPFDIDLKKAYQHVKHENGQLLEDVKLCRIESEKAKATLEIELSENACLKDDVTMLKNLVYRLNMELEKFQDLRDKAKGGSEAKKPYELPQYYNKNFLKPLLPLLRAYTETIQEKNEVIESLEHGFDKFNVSFNELLKENETLYKELEAKLNRGNEDIFEEVKLLRAELNMTKEEKELLQSYVQLEVEKLVEVKAVFQTKVSLLERERDIALDKLQEARADLYTLQGKNSVVKQELERLRSDEDMKVPLAVHSASVGECKRLFQNLKNEQDNEKQELIHKLNDCNNKLLRKVEELSKNEQERLTLEQSNFDLVFDGDDLRKKVSQLEKRLDTAGNAVGKDIEVQELRTKLLDASKKNDDLEGKLQRSKKKLQQSMAFAEDLVKEQESLLAQLHEKQRENSAMATHFGSLKMKLKSVEKGANAGLEAVEDTIKDLRAENDELNAEIGRLNMLLREKDVDNTLATEETSS